MAHKVMLIDDEPSLTRLLQISLEATGKFEVMAINDAKSAIPAAREFLPDVMILDVLMPDLLGNEIVPLISEIPELAHTKFIFLTALMRKSDPESALTTHPRILSKPVTTDILVEAIQDVLGLNEISNVITSGQ